jgi:glycosyltransferase involved in cell wall biosynthesis
MRSKILFIVQLPPPVHGASIVNQFIVNSKKINTAYETKVLPLQFVSDVEQIGKFSFKKVGLMIRFSIQLIIELVKFRPHLVYFTITPKGGAFYRDALFVLLIKLFRCKLVFHLHSQGIQRSRFNNILKEWINRFVYRNTSVICLSKNLLSEFDNLKVREVLFLPNGIPEYPYELATKRQSEPIILFLSNLFKAKGILVFLDIIEKLKSQSVVFNAKIIGMGGDVSTSDLQQLVGQRNLSDVICVLGPQYGEEKYRAFAEASIFVMPSFNEAFPLTVLEALQASLPVVASNVGGIPEIIQDGKNGYLCPPGNSDAFAEKITILLQDVFLRQQMSYESRRVFEEKYTISHFEAGLKDIIDHLLEEKHI